MKNIRSKINQLRVAYFVPTRPVVRSTGQLPSLNASCAEKDLDSFGTCTFCTPCVSYVTYLPSINSGNYQVQTPSVCVTCSPFSSPTRAFCVPRVKSVLPISPVGFRLGVLDYTSYVRNGYRNYFHQYWRPYTVPNYLPHSVNLFF